LQYLIAIYKRLSKIKTYLPDISVMIFGILAITSISVASEPTNQSETSPQQSDTSVRIFTAKKKQALENYIDRHLLEYNIPGVAVGIVESGKAVYEKGFGISNEKGTLVSPKTSFEIGSVTKTFTAIAIMQLWEEGKIDIDKAVIDYIPWFQSKNKTNSDRILIKHLLTHKSGFSRIVGNRNMENEDHSIDAVKNSIAELPNFELVSEPGEKFEYSNINFQLLGYILELLEHDSYESIIEKRIFQKLGMNNSFIKSKPKTVIDKSQGFIFWFGNPKPTKISEGRVDVGAGLIYSSVEDLNLYLADIISSNGKLLSTKAKNIMFMPEKTSENFYYAYG